MAAEAVIVVDCGSTNITVFAVGPDGQSLAACDEPNKPVPQAGAPEAWRVWDLDELTTKVFRLCRECVAEVGSENVRALTITTWGADGAPLTSEGELTYPPIAWECPRTEGTAERVSTEIGARNLYNVTGYQVISFNTLFRLAWLRENEPETLEKADRWMMMPGLLSYQFCEQMSVDVTDASTMMALDLQQGGWSEELLSVADLDSSFFPPLIYPGEVIGEVTDDAAEQCGIPAGTPVVAGGHDTQFALIGSGATPDEAVLSSGTWEILMLRTSEFQPNELGFVEGMQTELDAKKGLFNPQLLMMGSGVLEWVRENFYAGIEERNDAYNSMIEEARKIGPGSGQVMMVPSFVPDSGPTKKYNTEGTIVGLGLQTDRGHVYRACLEGLTFQLRDALRIIKDATRFEPSSIRVVGGGSRNALWNQIRADVCNLPVTVTAQKEATVMGGAIVAWMGAGRFSTISEGQDALTTESSMVEPSGERDVYDELFERYKKIPPALENFYTT
ncbi:MAG: L-fuculokinase [Planctomycetes bacterium]|nr:L-fuculokinase [Planctomycetota bacterium]